MEDQLKQQGAFSWCELMTTDVPAAKEFYSKLFGWETRDEKMTDMVYTMIEADGCEVGGIMEIPKQAKDMRPAWGTYVTVDDVDATADTAEALGGTIIVHPQDIPNVGRFCVIQDPQGAIVSAITYKSE